MENRLQITGFFRYIFLQDALDEFGHTKIEAIATDHEHGVVSAIETEVP